MTKVGKKRSITKEDLLDVIEERGKRIRKKFAQTVVSGVSNPQLLAILSEIGDNRRDAFRPALTSLACEAVGGQPAQADEAGLMLTLASAGFGIHDDIIDRSSCKHFRTTIRGSHGVEAALLVGDLLIVKAWTTIHEMIQKSNRPEKIKTILEEYGRLNVEICEAEFLENLSRKKLDTDLEARAGILWEAMAEIEACTRIGAIMGDGGDEEIRALGEFGRRLGFTYRLTDEVRDTLNLEGNLPDRIENESVPLPILFAANSSENKRRRAQSIIQKSCLVDNDIKELLEICFESGAFEYVAELAEGNKKKAALSLRSLKASWVRDVLFFMNSESYRSIVKLAL